MPDLLGGWEYTWPYYAAIPIAFLIGSIPFGLLLAHLAGAGDLRRIGSGNIGATNVLRTGRKGLAVATLLLDAGKGLLAVKALGYWGPDFEFIAGLFVVLGHMLPPWLGFRGGKGVATALGVVYAVSWPVGLAASAVWLLVAALFRFSSLASMTMVIAAPVLLWAMLTFQRDGVLPFWLPGLPQHVDMLIGIALLVLVRHRGNIARLLRRKEPRIGQAAPEARKDDPSGKA